MKQFHFYTSVVHGAICRSRSDEIQKREGFFSRSVVHSLVSAPHLSFTFQICRSDLHKPRSPVVQISTSVVHPSFRSPHLSFRYPNLSFRSPHLSFTCRSDLHNPRSPVVQISTSVVQIPQKKLSVVPSSTTVVLK